MDAESLKKLLDGIGDIGEFYEALSPTIQKIAEIMPAALIDILKPALESDELRMLLVKSKAATLKAYVNEGFSREEAVAFMLSDVHRLASYTSQLSASRGSSSR